MRQLNISNIPHRVPMLSIDNTYHPDDLRAYLERTEKLLDREPVEWVMEYKIDGVAASVLYRDGPGTWIDPEVTERLGTILPTILKQYMTYLSNWILNSHLKSLRFAARSTWPILTSLI